MYTDGRAEHIDRQLFGMMTYEIADSHSWGGEVISRGSVFHPTCSWRSPGGFSAQQGFAPLLWRLSALWYRLN